MNELYDEQIAIIQPHISSGKFIVFNISIVEIVEIELLSKEDIHLSEQDWSAIYFAQKQEAIILSGDKRLRSMAKAKGLISHGVLWIMDMLCENSILTGKQSCDFLTLLMNSNKRIPLVECNKRIALWNDVNEI